MKTLLAIFLLLPLAAFADDMRAASHFVNDPERYLGQKITLNCCGVERMNDAVKGSDDVCFRAFTGSRGAMETSCIMVHVPKDAAEQFAHKYGSNKNNWDTSQSRPLSGTFSKEDPAASSSSDSSSYSHRYNSYPYFLAYTPSS